MADRKKPDALKQAAQTMDIISDPIRDPALLPNRVAALRTKILEACAKGDIEALRIPIDWNEVRPLFERGTKSGPGADPIETLKRLSYDGKGLEILLLLRAILKQACVEEIRGVTRSYIWPAFALKPPPAPTFEERQIMLSCVRFADLGKIAQSGAPPVLRVGIGADGTWHYFW